MFIPLVASAASEYESDENVAIGVIGTAGTGATYELSPSKLFESEEDYGQDLYEFIYNRVKHEAADNAAARVLADRHLSKEELFIVVPGANIGQLLKKDDPRQKLDPDKIEAERKAIQGDFAEALRLADVETIAKLEVEPTEIFSNGDESDSGFDLIVDLDIIETILFGRTESVLGGAGPGAPPGAEVVGVGGGAGAGAGPAPGAAPGAGPGGAPTGASAGAGASAPSGANGGAGGGEGAAPSAAEAGAVCPLNDSFNAAVEQIREAERAAREEAGVGPGAGAGGGGAGSGGEDEDEGPGAGGAGGGAEEEGEEDEEKTPLTPESAGDWSRPLPCNSVFCLKIEAVYKTESAYLANENCIACHFEKINDSFKKTLDHNLVPSKATGNLFEGPKCKRSLLGLKWNFILIPQPILTPPNDDLIPKGDFLVNFVDFLEKYYRLPGSCDELKKEIKNGGNIAERIQDKLGLCKPPPDPEQEAARNILNQIPEGTTQDTIIRRIRENAEAKKQEIAETMEKSRLENDAQNQATQYQVLMQEIETFNGYFKGFMELYKKLVDPEQADNPCNTLTNKPTCS